MPESPEVEALTRFLSSEAAGREVRDVDVLEYRVVKTRSSPPASIAGRTITGARRHGKHVELALDRGSLVVSLGRHGWMRWHAGAAPVDSAPDEPPALVSLTLAGDRELELTDAGSWVSLGLFVVGDARDVPAIAKLGPDPADPDFGRAQFDAAVGGRRKQIKAILQEQESLAGIGNAYSDEILHLARISPLAHAAALDEDQRARLFDAILSIVRGAIAARSGVPIDRLKAEKVAAMRVHGRTGEPCPVCGDTVADIDSGSTTAQYCPTCQNGGARL